ncbi:MAG: hypothetical protein A2V77_06800 [Anaeromyxobacter sp. RBG_16_69_14]|nr:MAG: hypothetical protein A2V77_06800 [Anaeromyxobacter sp. RBG_16_69_14]
MCVAARSVATRTARPVRGLRSCSPSTKSMTSKSGSGPCAGLGERAKSSHWERDRNSTGRTASLGAHRPRSRRTRASAASAASTMIAPETKTSARTFQPVSHAVAATTSPPRPWRWGPCCQRQSAQGSEPSKSPPQKAHWSQNSTSTA